MIPLVVRLSTSSSIVQMHHEIAIQLSLHQCFYYSFWFTECGATNNNMYCIYIVCIWITTLSNLNTIVVKTGSDTSDVTLLTIGVFKFFKQPAFANGDSCSFSKDAAQAKPVDRCPRTLQEHTKAAEGKKFKEYALEKQCAEPDKFQYHCVSTPKGLSEVCSKIQNINGGKKSINTCRLTWRINTVVWMSLLFSAHRNINRVCYESIYTAVVAQLVRAFASQFELGFRIQFAE